MPKIEKYKWDILSYFQTMWLYVEKRQKNIWHENSNCDNFGDFQPLWQGYFCRIALKVKLVSFFLSTLTSQQMVKRRREITVDSSWCPVIWTQKNCIMRTTTEDSWIISKSVCKKFCIINANWARYRKSTVIMINHFYQAGEMTKLDQLRMSRLSFWRENSNIST